MTAVMSTFDAYQVPPPPPPPPDGALGEARNNINNLIGMKKPGDSPRATKSEKYDTALGLKDNIIPRGRCYKRQSNSRRSHESGKGEGSRPPSCSQRPLEVLNRPMSRWRR